MDTIIAPLTTPGQGAVSLIRISGTETKKIAEKLVQAHKNVLEKPRHTVYSAILDPHQSSVDVLDWGLATFFAKPRSFTGEDTLEISLHASPYLVKRCLEIACAQGARLARAGEFSERAFLNGQIDLSQAEAIADLVQAETEAQARVAREQLEGKLSRAISELGEPLRDLVAEIEAQIDFPEEDIDPSNSQTWQAVISQSLNLIAGYIDSFKTGRLYREGATLALAGPPNAGKSSLLNRLLGEERVIVSPKAGTTRDAIEARISLDGLALSIWDTAGLAQSSLSHKPDEIEQIGIQHSWKRLRNADLVLYLIDLSSPLKDQMAAFSEVDERAQSIIIVANKTDLVSQTEQEQAQQLIAEISSQPALLISAASGLGVEQLKRQIGELLFGQKKHSQLPGNLHPETSSSA